MRITNFGEVHFALPETLDPVIGRSVTLKRSLGKVNGIAYMSCISALHCIAAALSALLSRRAYSIRTLIIISILFLAIHLDMSLPLIARRLLHLLGLTQSIFNKPTASPVRQATPADLNAVVEVVLSTMPQDPQWNYRFPYRDKYPEDHLKYTSMLFEYFIDPSYDDWLVMVVDAPDIKNPKVSKIVAFSIWDVSYINKAKYGPSYQPQNRE